MATPSVLGRQVLIFLSSLKVKHYVSFDFIRPIRIFLDTKFNFFFKSKKVYAANRCGKYELRIIILLHRYNI